jgi:rhamnose transport system permease protein
MQRFTRELSLAGALASLLAALAIFAPQFFAAEHLRNLSVAAAPILVAALAATAVMLARQIDVSIGAQFSWCAVTAGMAVERGLPSEYAVLVALAVGASYGAANGWLTAGLGLPPIVATLATMAIGREALRWLREGEFVRGLPSDFQWLGWSQTVGQWTIVGVALAVFLSVAWSLRRLPAGRMLYAVGSDPEAARLAGIRPPRVIFGAYVFAGTLVGLAAMLSSVRFSAVDPNDGNGLEMQAIAAAVLGGVAVSGGRGSAVGVLLGAALLACIGPALVFLKLPPQWERAVQGAVILVAVAGDSLTRRGRK